MELFMKRLSLLVWLMSLSAFTSGAEKILSFDKNPYTEDSSRIVSQAYFIASYQECVGEENKPLLTLKAGGVHGKIQSPLKKLQKNLSWQQRKLGEVEKISKKILLWDLDEADKSLELSESDIELTGSFVDSLRKATRHSLETYFATIVWGDEVSETNFTKGSKCYSISLAKVRQDKSYIDGDFSFKDKVLLNVGLPVAVVLNRVVSTERYVRKEYLKWSAEDLSLIKGFEERCLVANNTINGRHKDRFSQEYMRQAQALCSAVNSEKIQAMKPIRREFYDLTLNILLKSGETKVSRKSRYSTLFKDYQSTEKTTFKAIREIEVLAVNYETELRREYAVAYLEDKESDLTAELSLALDQVLIARGKGLHLDYFPYYKLIEWRDGRVQRIAKLNALQSNNPPEQSYAVRVADCILKDKEDYLSLDWYHENRLRLFTEKFYEIETARDKLVFDTPTAKREKDLLKKIGHSKSNALKFLIHAQETGKMHHQELLLNLLACNGE
jgi:hypothetical protein